MRFIVFDPLVSPYRKVFHLLNLGKLFIHKKKNMGPMEPMLKTGIGG